MVVSSRARLARNLPAYPFSPRASKEELAAISQDISAAVASSDYFGDYLHFSISALDGHHRRFLRESHLISKELEKGQENRDLYLSPAGVTSLMVAPSSGCRNT